MCTDVTTEEKAALCHLCLSRRTLKTNDQCAACTGPVHGPVVNSVCLPHLYVSPCAVMLDTCNSKAHLHNERWIMKVFF